MKGRYKFFVVILLLFVLSGCAGSGKSPVKYSDLDFNKLDEIKRIIEEDPAKINRRDENGNSLLHMAVRAGNIEIVKYLVSRNADVNIENSRNETPLQLAVNESSLEIVKYLISHGADVGVKDNFNKTPLHNAVIEGEIELVKFIVSQGPDLNAKDNSRESPLFIAIRHNRLDIANYLISQGAELNSKDNTGRSPLHEAVVNGHFDLVKNLILQGADINAKDRYDIYPLHDAANEGKLEITKYLVSHGAEVNVRGVAALAWHPFNRTLGCTPLHLAANKGHLEIVKYLISHGADLNIKNNDDNTPLDLAEKRQHKEIVAFLTSSEVHVQISEASGKTEETYTKEEAPKVSKVPMVSTVPEIDFGRYYALVIGSNDYTYLPKLKTARNDAQEVADILNNKYGFTVDLLFDANRSDVLLALSALRYKLTDQDNLLIYYAGHGWLDKEADEGYWLPVDAEQDNMINWISNSSITATLRAIQAKHVLIVADSCYSGKLARGIHTVQRTPGYLLRLSKRRARCVISSGGLEPVIDSGGEGIHSVFASAFIKILKENNDILDGVQLFNQIRRPVMLNSDQTPEYSDIRKAGHEGGEFIFVPLK